MIALLVVPLHARTCVDYFTCHLLLAVLTQHCSLVFVYPETFCSFVR